MNMRVLKRSRKLPQEGDIFAYQFRGRPFGYGRVIRLHTKIGGFTDVILLYIYRAFSREKLRIPVLDKKQLLIPPVGINRRPWTMGYFETIESRPLSPEDVLSVHCFKDDIYDKVRYVDEFGRTIPRRVRPCGVYALDSFRTIDASLSLAMGIEPSPDTVP
jgi:hypothetical protein